MTRASLEKCYLALGVLLRFGCRQAVLEQTLRVCKSQMAVNVTVLAFQSDHVKEAHHMSDLEDELIYDAQQSKLSVKPARY